MTEPRKNNLAATFSVDFECARCCRAEVNLDGVSVRHTLGQMLAKADEAHEAAHRRDAVRVFPFGGDVIVRSLLLAGAA